MRLHPNRTNGRTIGRTSGRKRLRPALRQKLSASGSNVELTRCARPAPASMLASTRTSTAPSRQVTNRCASTGRCGA
ncbi:MAG: hypothetical protein DWI10_08605 [Planctomycetota bacterium]|nr:MAG: hypothetical protein DWI10_08605 [Planctomycetota bacterium]